MSRHPNCSAKHPAYQPTDDEFKCPRCNAKSGEFFIGEAAWGSHEDCEDVHSDDYLRCSKCNYGVSAKTFVKDLMRKKSLVKCPHCKGVGVVPGEEK